MKLAALLMLALAAPADPRAVWLAHARAAHLDADRDAVAGHAALQSFLDEPAPEGISADDARTVRQDAWFHLALVDLRTNGALAAATDADRGLALGKSDDLFTANLLIVRGRARELLQDDRGAVADYSEAQRINEALLRAETGGRP